MKVLIYFAVAASAFAQYSMRPAGPSPATAAMVESTGVEVSTAGGKVWCELWPAKALQASGKAVPEDSVSLPAIPHGAFLGIARFPAQVPDRRGNPVQAGVYAMRYSTFPNDGNHMGAAPQRDFVILIPVEKDKPPAEAMDYEALMRLSRESTGMPHPAVLSLAPSNETRFPELKKEGDHDWTLHLRIGGMPVALIVAGRAES